MVSSTQKPVRRTGLPWLWIGAGLLLVGLLLAAVVLWSPSLPRLGRGCVGVIEVSGEIVPEDTPDSLFSSGSAGSGTLVQQIEEADRRADVRAILVRINSPGGSPLASREIYQALNASSKPKAAYMRELAASGGYYVAAGTDYIVSEPDALTGSIGVRASVADLSGLFGKLGYNETVIKSGELKDIGSSSRPMTEKERAILQGIVNETFEEFRGVVVASRSTRLVHPQFEEALDARVLTGRQAQAIGLVDEIGNQKAAIRYLSARLNESEPLPTCEISGASGSSLFSRLFAGQLALPGLSASGSELRLQYR